MNYNFSKRGCKGIIYDGVSISDIFQIVDIKIPLLPSFSAVTHEMIQRPGAYFVARNIETREIVIKLRLDAESRDPTDIFKDWRKVADVFNKPTPRKLYLNDDKYCNAIFVGESSIVNEAYYGDVEFVFTCFDPYFYSNENTVEITSVGSLEIPVGGNVDTYPIFDLKASATAVTIANEVTGEYVKIPNTQSGAVLHADMGQQRVTIGGEYAPVDLLSDFFSIQDQAQIKVTGATGTITYRERYL